MKSHSIVTQHDLNMLEVGSTFDSTDHSAQLLTLLFFAMMYAPGLPLLMPLCCFAFTVYFRVDKLLLCRYYQKPPNVGDAAIKLALYYLPFAAVLRLAIGVWMLGNTDILKTTLDASQASYKDFLISSRNEAGTSSDTNNKIFQSNTFPLFILLLFILVCIFIISMWKKLPVYWIYKIISSIVMKQVDIFENQKESGTVTAWELLRLDDPLRQQSAAFTNEYFRLIKHRDEIPDTCFKMFSYAYLTQLSEVDIEEGYKMQDRGDFVVKVKLWTQFDNKKIDGTRSKHGELKRTYEVVANHRCYSYDIEKVPEYRIAIQGLREGTTSLLDYLDENRLLDSTGNKNILFEKAGLTSNIIADYEKRKKNRNVAAIDGFDFFNDMEEGNVKAVGEENEEDYNLDSRTKAKPSPATRNEGTGKRSHYVAVDTQETIAKPPKTEPLDSRSTSGQPTNRSNAASTSTAQGKPTNNNRNFTFDDFNFDEAMQQHQQAPPPKADISPTTTPTADEAKGDDDDKHASKHSKNHKKDKKKKKKDHHDH
jgi:hypothetical protein